MPSNAVKKPRKKVETRPVASAADLRAQVKDALAALERMSTVRDRENLARFGITASKAYGVSMANIQKLAKRLGRSHELAAALWDTGVYEARLLTAYVDEPEHVTSAQMDRWCRDFDNWGICDTLCFCLFDRTPYAWDKVAKWHGHRDEFVKRASFALLASLAGHDKTAGDDRFLEAWARGARRRRRAQLRQEGRELGPAAHRVAERRAERGRARGGWPACRIPERRVPLDRKGRAARARQSRRPATVCGPGRARKR